MPSLHAMLPVHAYLYRDPTLGHGSDAVVCVIDRRVADAYLGVDQVTILFGGCAVYVAPAGQEFIGVWGARNASRLRRFLRERGAIVTLRQGRPLGLRLRYTETQPGRRPRLRILGVR